MAEIQEMVEFLGWSDFCTQSDLFLEWKMKTLNHFIKFYEINFSVSSSLCMALETFLDKQNCRWFLLILSNGGWPLWHLNFEWHGRPCFLQLSRAWKCFVNLSSRASTFTHWLRKKLCTWMEPTISSRSLCPFFELSDLAWYTLKIVRVYNLFIF